MLVHQTRFLPASFGSKRESHVFSRMSLTRRNTSLRDNAKLRMRLARRSSPKQATSCFSPRDRPFHFQQTPMRWHFSATRGRSCKLHTCMPYYSAKHRFQFLFTHNINPVYLPLKTCAFTVHSIHK
ncbi:hypothetical protein CGCTS75_v010401 [Colletotrichum tropicale]|nr:hypothetical protein CGCTS75_v010401 [Colletotrichum tropicale]